MWIFPSVTCHMPYTARITTSRWLHPSSAFQDTGVPVIVVQLKWYWKTSKSRNERSCGLTAVSHTDSQEWLWGLTGEGTRWWCAWETVVTAPWQCLDLLQWLPCHHGNEGTPATQRKDLLRQDQDQNSHVVIAFKYKTKQSVQEKRILSAVCPEGWYQQYPLHNEDWTNRFLPTLYYLVC